MPIRVKGPLILAKIQIYTLTREELLCTLYSEMPCNRTNPLRPQLRPTSRGQKINSPKLLNELFEFFKAKDFDQPNGFSST